MIYSQLLKEKNIKIFTMIKDEKDILINWIYYYGNIFGFKNLYIIDNYSIDGSWDILKNFQIKYKINLYREKNYKNKGKIITDLSKSIDNYDYILPVDIDEFIVLYNYKENLINIRSINNYFKSLPKNFSIYKMNYIQTILDKKKLYKNVTVECSKGYYQNCNKHAKSFFNKKKFKGLIDHGNHFVCKNYFLTDLCLVHFNKRNYMQFRNKIINNVINLGLPVYSKKLLIEIQKNKGISHHYVKLMIDILENKYTFPPPQSLKPSDKIISLNKLNTYMKIIMLNI